MASAADAARRAVAVCRQAARSTMTRARHQGPGAVDFEHIVVVNDPAHPGGAVIPSHALRDALRLLAVRPQSYDESIGEFELEVDARGVLRRTMRRGALALRDHVRLYDDDCTYEQVIDEPAPFAGSVRRIAIEVPAPGVLLLRFVYRGRRALPDEALTAAERGALRSAYLGADRDFVAALRSLHAHGALATLLRLHAPPGSFPHLPHPR